MRTARRPLRAMPMQNQMPQTVRFSLIILGAVFVTFGCYQRIKSQRSGERLDRSKEGWAILISIRLLGLLTWGITAAWLFKPELFGWATGPMPEGARWTGVAGFACTVAWLMWMFHSLGRNLTDTVVVRQDAYLVDHGPYRFVRNPMYTGVLMVGFSLGLALGTLLLPLAASLMFALFAIRTRTEEAFLIARFGDNYRRYMERVGRFLPKPPTR